MGLKNSSHSKCNRLDAVAVVVNSPSRQRGVIQITWDSIQCVIWVCLFVCQDWDWVSRDWMSQSQVAADPPNRGRAAAAISNVVPIILVRLLTTTTAASFF